MTARDFHATPTQAERNLSRSSVLAPKDDAGARVHRVIAHGAALVRAAVDLDRIGGERGRIRRERERGRHPIARAAGLEIEHRRAANVERATNGRLRLGPQRTAAYVTT